MTKCTKYGSLSPYELKDENNNIMENIWQGEKVYKKTPSINLTYSRYDSTII